MGSAHAPVGRLRVALLPSVRWAGLWAGVWAGGAGCGGLVIFQEPAPDGPGEGGSGAATAATSAATTAASGTGGQVGTGGAGGGGGEGGEGGAPACTSIRQACETFCEACGGPEPGSGCAADCLAFHAAASPSCGDAYLEEIACLAEAAQGTAGCAGALQTCGGEVDAFAQCVGDHPECNGYACAGCNCNASCGGGTWTDCDPEGEVCGCVVDGVFVGECLDRCGVDALACCADLAAGACP